MLSRFALLLFALLLPAVTAFGQAPQLANVPAPGIRTSPYRTIVPGIEVTIPPDRQEDDTFSTHDVIEIVKGVPNLKWTPKQSPSTRTLQEMATQTVFRHKIWYLELTFKPVRMIWVDMPQETGKMQRKLVWYMVYRVKNTGKHYSPRRNEDGTYTIDSVDEPVRFYPQFVLEAPEVKKAYLDRVVPVAIQAIQQKEDPNRKLLSTVEISAKSIPLSTDQVDNSVWGVATWEDVDPAIDLFSVYVEGLTNAYKWLDVPGKERVFGHKTLVLNFWRPGDEETEDQRTIRFGIPSEVAQKYQVPDVDYRWVYR